MAGKLRVGILFGGRSGEHEVSLMSVQSVLQAMRTDRYEIRPIGIDKSGRWLFTSDPLAELRQGLPSPPEAPLWPSPDHFADIDVLLPILHGTYGEDGTLQGFLDLTGIPYVGCGTLASALAMDKAISKEVFASHGLPQTPWRVLLRKTLQEAPDDVVRDLERHLQYPMFVKPANLGSSVGIGKANNRQDLILCLRQASAYDRKIVVEQAVANAREIEVSVLGNDEPIASIPGEILPSNEFYDYAAKYLDGASEERIPAPIGPERTATIQEMALAAFRAIDGSGMARVDFLLDDIAGQVYLNEINTIPGFTLISMYPKLWAASGIPFSDLIDRLIDLALERHVEKVSNRTSYDDS